MFILYDLIFLLFAIFYLPVFVLKRKIHRGFRMRLGILPQYLEFDKPIWVHAVSVGEVMAVRHLIEELRIAYPDKRLVISTVTTTGNRVARNIIARDGDFASYLPLDLSFIVRSVVDRIRPSIFVIVETEIWPNLITYLYRKNIPIVVVNGRISDSSFKGYLSIRLMLKSVLNKINLFCVQTNRDAERLLRLGVSKDKIRITGNMKFDLKAASGKDDTDYRLKLGLEVQEKIFVSGSTHPGEEEIILSVYQKLISEFPKLRLLIVPRHPERASEIAGLIKKFGFQAQRISLLNTTTRQQLNTKTVFVLDTVGQLLSFYAMADIVFVGGSLIKKGGHNILEPASLEKPVLFGPYMFNFRDIADLFMENKACVLVRSEEELKASIKDLLNSPSKIDALGKRAKSLILQNQGATRRNLEYILGCSRGKVDN